MTPHSPTENVVAMVICRDAAATLPATLASVLAERPGAIIVAWTPAGAADATPAIVQRLAQEAELLRVETPGIAAARNAAVAAALARGKPLMAWCDADDRTGEGHARAGRSTRGGRELYAVYACTCIPWPRRGIYA